MFLIFDKFQTGNINIRFLLLKQKSVKHIAEGNYKLKFFFNEKYNSYFLYFFSIW